MNMSRVDLGKMPRALAGVLLLTVGCLPVDVQTGPSPSPQSSPTAFPGETPQETMPVSPTSPVSTPDTGTSPSPDVSSPTPGGEPTVPPGPEVSPTATAIPGGSETPPPPGTASPAPTDAPASPTPPELTTAPALDGDGDGSPASLDCNDANSSIYPGAAELCNHLDDDCDQLIDEGVETVFYADQDQDGFGQSSVQSSGCVAPVGFAALDGDCNDGNSAMHPGSTVSECGIGTDFNCDGVLGTLIQPGETFPVDLNTVSVDIQVSLGGNPISVTNVSSTDFGALYVHNTTTGERFHLGDLWNVTTDTPVGTVHNTLAPGFYDLEYWVQVNGVQAPDNEGAILLEGLDLTTSRSLSVDIPVVTITTSLTLKGSQVTGSNTSSSDYGKIALRDTRTGEKFPLFSAWNANSGTAVGAYPARLIPGIYDVIYEVGKDGSRWPANLETVLQRSVDLTTSRALTIDVPVIDLTVKLTLNGEAVATGNTTSSDYGRIQLKDLETGALFKYYNTYDSNGGKPVASFTGQVLPGIYDVSYKGQKSVRYWPLNSEEILASALTITSSQTQSFDLLTSTLTVSSLTLGGTLVSTANTTATDYGTIRLRDARGIDFKLADTWSNTNSAPRSTFSSVVFRGVYDIVYAFKAGGVLWPLNEKAQLHTGLDLTTAQTITLDVPVVQVSCELLLNGVAVSSSNTSATDYGKLVVRQIADQDRFKLCSAWSSAAGAPAPKVKAALVPGLYQVLYDAEQDGPSWPGNQDVLLTDVLDIRTPDQVVRLDVPARTMSLSLTLAGQAASGANTSATDYGLLELWNMGIEADMFDAYASWDGTQNQVVPVGQISLLPGSYDVLYTVGADGTSWAADEQRLMGCFTLR